MRARLTFGLAALTLLFLIQALNALFPVLFAVSYDAVFPRFHPARLLLVLPPIAALLTPALPFSRWIERPAALALGAVGAAAGRVVLCFSGFLMQYIGAAVTVAAGALFLAKAVGYLDRRNVAIAAAAALVVDGLLRTAGASWSIALRPGWLPVQLGLSAVAVVLTGVWLRDPQQEEDGGDSHRLERRAGGLRLRGAIAFAIILFFELNLLGRPEVAARWTGVSYRAAAIALAGTGAAAVALLLGARGPIGRQRRVALTLILVMLAGVLLARTAHVPGALRLALFAFGHAAALLLLARAVVPAGGRRRGWTLAAGLALLSILNALFAFTFFYAFTIAALRGALPAIVIAAGVLLALVVSLIPRPVEYGSRLRHPPLAAAVVLAVAAVAWLASPHERVADTISDGDVRVGSYNVHYGYDGAWRYDPERIARTIEESGADVVALQEVPAGLLIAHGTDLARWLGHRLGMRAGFSPSINGLLGDALLSRLPVTASASTLLPPAEADRKSLTRAAVVVGADTVAVYATHLGLSREEQRVQIDAALAAIGAATPAVFMGDLNATETSDVARALRNAGFRDAFEVAAVPAAPTAPADRPTTRIDWIWLRGVVATDAGVSAGGGSDHRLVTATIRLTR